MDDGASSSERGSGIRVGGVRAEQFTTTSHRVSQQSLDLLFVCKTGKKIQMKEKTDENTDETLKSGNKNRDGSTGPHARPFAHSLALLASSFAALNL